MYLTAPAAAAAGASCVAAPSASRPNRFMIAGVAAAGAAAMAINPVAPMVPALPDVKQHAIQLAANPLADFGGLFKNTLTNVGVLGDQVIAGTIPAVAQAITNPQLYADFIKFLGSNVLNPLPALQQVLGFNSLYGGVLGLGMKEGAVALQERLQQLPGKLAATFEFLQKGQFVEAFSEINVWFLVSIERALVPLLPTLGIPGDILAALPGGERLSAVFDTILKRGVFTEFTRSIMGPPITALLQFSVILDTVRHAVVTGDAKTAISELVALPIKVVNAFVNGFTPPFETRSPWTGVLGPKGTLTYFLHDLPKALFDAINNPVYPTPPVTTPTTPALAQATSISTGGATVAVDLADESSAEAAPVAGDAPAEAPVGAPEETVVPVAEEEDDSEAADEAADEAVDEAADEAGDEAGGGADGSDSLSDDDSEADTDGDEDRDSLSGNGSTGNGSTAQDDSDTDSDSDSDSGSSRGGSSSSSGSTDGDSSTGSSSGGSGSGGDSSGSDD